MSDLTMTPDERAALRSMLAESLPIHEPTVALSVAAEAMSGDGILQYAGGRTRPRGRRRQIRQLRLPGRNDPCPCGSGRKWKRCCGR